MRVKGCITVHHSCISPKGWNAAFVTKILAQDSPHALLQGFGVRHAMNPDPYRGPFGNDGHQYAADVADLIRGATSGQIAGFIAETIQGVGGTTPLADGYLPEVYKVS